MNRLLRLLCILLASLALVSGAQAQWLVYELTFTEQPGSVNFSFYTGAYVIAPVNGGAASVVFTTEVGGNFYATSENGMRYFIAANQNVRQGALSAFTINGTASAFYTASGELDTTVNYLEQGVSRSIRAPGELSGTLLAADDESFQEPANDGSLGMVGRASIAGILRPDLTDIVNGSSITMKDAMGAIIGLLEKYGYQSDVGDVPSESLADPSGEQMEAAAPGTDVSALFGGQPMDPSAPQQPTQETAEVIDPSLFPANFEE